MINKNEFAFHLFLLAVLSSFITVKIYPVMYLLCALYTISQGVTFKNSVVVLFSIPFFIYTILIYIFITDAKVQSDLAFYKFIVNFLFFISVCISGCFFKTENVNSKKLLEITEFYLRWALILSLLQMFFLQMVSGGLRLDAGSSYAAGMMFNDHPIFWGVEDKNMSGAKIGLFGFLHAFVYKRLNGKISFKYALLYIVCAALTLSRTSVILAFLTFLVLYLFSIKPIYRYMIVVPVLAVFIFSAFSDLSSFIRLDSVRAGSADDGMAVRILYWSAFFHNFDAISPFGNGILSAIDFLGLYSVTGSANNMHNLYINNFLDLGYLGTIFYFFIMGAVSITIYIKSKIKTDCIVILFPIILLTNTLYTAYDNDPWLYYALAIVVSGLYVNNNKAKDLA